MMANSWMFLLYRHAYTQDLWVEFDLTQNLSRAAALPYGMKTPTKVSKLTIFFPVLPFPLLFVCSMLVPQPLAARQMSAEITIFLGIPTFL
jgi:hypothetical protein